MTTPNLDNHPLYKTIEDAARVASEVAQFVPTITEISVVLAASLTEGKKLIACGNGGSAADAQHLTGEWTGRFVRDRRSYPAIALTADGPLITAIANDYGYEEVFARQVRGFGAPGDVFVGFTTSGNSESILRALQAAREAQMITVALLGRDGGRTKNIADHEIIINSMVTARIQEAHGLIVHLICEETERILGI